MKEKNKKRSVTPADLDLTKLLLKAGVTIGAASKIIKLSYASIMALSRCETWADYEAHKESERVRMSKKRPEVKTFTTSTGLVVAKLPIIPVMTQFEMKLLNILTEIEQDLADLNQNVINSRTTSGGKVGWFK